MSAIALRAAFGLIVGLAGSLAVLSPVPARTALAESRGPVTLNWPAAHAALAEWAGPATSNDGAHRASPSEWWRISGHLHTPEGRRFAFAATFFRFAIAGKTDVKASRRAREQSAWRTGNEFYPATFALVDEGKRRYFSATKVERGAFGFGSAAANSLDVATGQWTLRAEPAIRHAELASPETTFDLHVANGEFALDLRQTAVKPRVAFGHAGVIRSGSCTRCVEHAFAYTRLRARGELRLGGQRFRLEGRSWLDHEYGTHELAPGDVGWDRFAIQLDDGRDVLVRVVRRADGTPSPATSGELVARDGTLTNLGARDVGVTPVAHTIWRSPASGARYPVLWEITVPKARLDLAVVPPFSAQEIVSQQGGPAYYEGSIDVERAPPPGGDTGTGFAELTGYRRPLHGL